MLPSLETTFFEQLDACTTHYYFLLHLRCMEGSAVVRRCVYAYPTLFNSQDLTEKSYIHRIPLLCCWRRWDQVDRFIFRTDAQESILVLLALKVYFLIIVSPEFEGKI